MSQKSRSMKSLDIVVLVKLCLMENEPTLQLRLAEELFVSQSQISKSISRSKYSGLLAENGELVMRSALTDFLYYGIRYVFPEKPGPITRGIPTAHSAYPLLNEIQSEENYVWPSATGQVRGHGVTPLYPSITKAVKMDRRLHEVLSLIDALRVGRSRERNLAFQMLEQKLNEEHSN